MCTIETIQEKEMYYRSKPTSEEIFETYQILRDFGIHIKKSEIPKKNTVGELHRWRYQIIKNYILNGWQMRNQKKANLYIFIYR